MHQRGFTLIEMAIVLVIIGILISGGLLAAGSLISQSRITQTATNLDQIENALLVFAIRNNRLPCPANGALASSSANYGLEQVSAGTPNTCSVALTKSVIPWITLGLDEQFSLDGWSHRIAYFSAGGQSGTGWGSLVDGGTAGGSGSNQGCLYRNYAASATNTRSSYCDSTTISGASYPFGNYIAVYAITAAGALGTELTVANPAAITLANVATAGNRAAYVLISHGPSGIFGYNKAGSQVADTGSHTLKTYNSNGSAGTAGTSQGFVEGAVFQATSANALYFDDIVRWRSPAMIIQLCGSGACGNP